MGATTVNQHAVLVHLSNPDSEGTLDIIEDALIAETDMAGAGEFDGVERDLRTGEAVFYLYGPDAERLAAIVHQVLEPHRGSIAGYLVKRYGQPGTREERVEL